MDVMQVEGVLPGLHASGPEALPFAPKLSIRAFLLQRDQGNLLVYGAPGLETDAETIRALGGASRHYLNHWHEAMFMPDNVPASVLVHQQDSAPASQRTRVDDTFSHRHLIDDDFEVIPTPGHTSGATAFLWDSGRHRFLFTGDTILLDEGSWVAAILDSSDRARYIESLELIRQLDFDVLVPWAASVGQPFHAATDADDNKQRIDAILDRLRRGEDH
jgi:Metallo-beta-lactamase superfamily